VALPWAIAASLIAVAAIADSANGVVLFAAGGFACSGFFPMTIGYGEASFPGLVTIAAGWLIASYQLGYGIAAFGAGALESTTSLSSLFVASAVLAAAMGLLAARISAIQHQRTLATEVP
jgi:hypothetical protein